MLRQRKAKDKTKLQKNSTETEQNPSDCIICLDSVSCRGKLSVCDHWFCFHCIFEWAKNTNTCPVCKARFRCITKIHVDTLKSPPYKVRVKDVDQPVWNAEDSIVVEDYEFSEDDFDDDYEPSIHVANPWTRQNTQRIRGNLNEYDFDDSFIVNDDDGNDDSEYDEDEDENGDSDGTESDDVHSGVSRTRRYALRHNGPALVISLPSDSDGSHCVDTRDSFIASEDDLHDSDSDQWMLPGPSNQSSQRQNESARCRVKKKPPDRNTSRPANTARRIPTSQRIAHCSSGSWQVSTRSKRKATVDGVSDEDQESDGWINMTERRENVAAAKSLHSARRQSKRRGRSGRSKEYRTVQNESSDSDGTDSKLVHSRKDHGNRQSRTRLNKRQKNSSSNPHSRSQWQTSQQQTLATSSAPSGHMCDSDTEEFLPLKTSRSKGKGKGKGKKHLKKDNGGRRGIIEPREVSSDENESIQLISLPSTSTMESQRNATALSKKSARASSSISRPHLQNISGQSESYLSPCNIGTRTKRNKTRKTVLSTPELEQDKENSGCGSSRQGQSRYRSSPASDKDCISPTPQRKRHRSFFTKRLHRMPHETFVDSDNGNSAPPQAPAMNLKVELMPLECASNVPMVSNVQKKVEREDSPVVLSKRKRLKVMVSDSE